MNASTVPILLRILRYKRVPLRDFFHAMDIPGGWMLAFTGSQSMYVQMVYERLPRLYAQRVDEPRRLIARKDSSTCGVVQLISYASNDDAVFLSRSIENFRVWVDAHRPELLEAFDAARVVLEIQGDIDDGVR